ncbi:hypothetical protein STENM327S_05707 [Streptomyces tendae]
MTPTPGGRTYAAGMRLHPLVADGLIAAALTTVAVLLGTEAVAQGWPALDPLAWTLVALLTLPLVLRTRAPVTVCLAVHACWAVYVTLGYWPVVGSFGPMLAVYTVASLRPDRTAAACAALLAGVWIYAGLRSDAGSMASVAGQAVGFPLVLWRFGYVARRTGELTLRLRAEQADRARREVAEERVRIARELHDVVAHHIAVINVQAGLARFVFHSDARTARDALDAIEGASGEALAELRRMLGLLRADGVQGADGAPAPASASSTRWSPGCVPAAWEWSCGSRAPRARCRPASSCASTGWCRRPSPTCSSTRPARTPPSNWRTARAR